ncbi:glycoside hydrolase family 25 protein [Streptomyces sp. NPDC052396]|uniref:glycoside hydrolase family 25 protein n=1 Tax=Streptomyces sp. NPDC052396 TaxID=3365689 RepID=UPI0037CD9271
MGIWGQDWASYQSSRPSTGGLSFAFVKVSEGLSYINPKWVAQRDHAKAHGLVWGGYHYPQMANRPGDEADYFLAQVNWKPGDLAVLDWEGYDDANSRVPRAHQAAYKEAWLRYVKARLPHNGVGMYCNLDYWRNVDTTSYYGDFLWIATAGRRAGDPGIRAAWMFHQYGDNGVDRDYCHLGSTAELRSWAESFRHRTPTTRLLEEEMLAFFTVPANTEFDLPVEPAGTLDAPQGGARNAAMWVALTPQGADGQVTTAFHREGGAWDRPAGAARVTVGGSKLLVDLPSDGSVDKVRIHSTVPLVGYLVGRQVA